MSPDDIANILQAYICFVIAIAVHEAAHAWAAWKCGDDMARLMGRITLNPAAHLEFWGSIVLPLLGGLLTTIGSPLSGLVLGWGKPVPVNLASFPSGKRSLYYMYVALAGPASNLLLALLGMIAMRAALFLGSEGMQDLLRMFIYINLGLFFFNLLPIPPLDGFSVARHLLGISEETHRNLAMFGLFGVLMVANIPAVRRALSFAMEHSFMALEFVVGL